MGISARASWSRREAARSRISARRWARRRRHLGEQVRDLEQAREAGAAQAEQLRDLNRRTVRLQEDERRRIAGEIHDAVSPLITGALYQARALRLGTPDDPGRSAARRDSTLDGIGELLSKAMEELHGVIFALRPPDLDDIGVVAAIERYIAQVQRSGLNVHLEAEEEPPPLTPEVRLAIYRIVQEALHNALRHAAADEAVVRFEIIDDVLRVTIRDNGAGFNPEHTARPTALGLLSMRERAAAIGATFAVMSRPGDGTTVMIERRHRSRAGHGAGAGAGRGRAGAGGQRAEEDSRVISVLLVDDHPVVIEGLRKVLATAGDLTVTGEAHDASGAIEKTRALHPDVVLLDLRMPGASGVQATRRLREVDDDVAIIILTSYGDQAYVRQALEAGADGYLLKSTPPEQADRRHPLRGPRSSPAQSGAAGRRAAGVRRSGAGANPAHDRSLRR